MLTRARARGAVRRMAEDAEGPRLRSRWRRIGAGRIAQVVLRTVEFVVALFIVGGLALASLLARGPLRLVGMHDQIQTSLQERVGDHYAIALGPTYFMRDLWGVGLGFKGLTVRDAVGRTVLSAPSGKISLDGFRLLFLDVRVSRLELDGLDLRLRVAADGAVSLAAASDSGATPIPPASSTGGATGLAALIRAAAEAMAGATQALDRLTLANGHFEIDNEATQRSVVYDDLTFIFDHLGSRAHARISATGPVGPWTIMMQASAGDAPTLSIDARDLSLADLQTFDKAPPTLTAEGPIAFKLDAELTAESALRAFTARFSVGAGRVRINDPDAVPFFIDEASGKLDWDDTEKELRFRDINILSGMSHVIAGGWFMPPASDTDEWVAHLESRDAALGPERPGANPVALTSVFADFHFIPAESRFVVDSFALRGPTVDALLSAETAPDGEGTSLKLDLTVNRSSTSDLMRLWPKFVNPDLREWCAQNLHGGQIGGQMTANWTAADLEAMNHKRALPRDSLRGSFTSHDVVVDMMPGLPPMVSDRASGIFTGRDVVISSNHATMTLTPTRRIQADNLSFTVPDTTPRAIVDAEASAHLIGTAEALADLLAREPLRKLAALEIDPATSHGKVEGDIALDLKLGKTAKPNDTQFRASRSLHVGIPTP
jgi:hypothetical protein